MGLHISLPFARRHAAAAHAAAARGKPPRATLEFLDADGAPVGRPLRPLVPAPSPIEVPNGAGGMDWRRPDPHLSLTASAVPARAVSVRARSGDTILAEAPLTDAATPAPAPHEDRRVFNGAGKWTLLLVSELFGDAARFFAFAAHLDSYIRGQAPFSRPGAGDMLRVEALFWPSPAKGLFKTRPKGRLVTGDNKLVNRFVDKAGATGRLTIVLVDMGVRGGAGGAPGRPAWVTIASAPGEQWEAVALHELGHSFGLADEYANRDQPTPEPRPLEPNVSASSDPARAPWAALVTPGHPGRPTCPAGVDPPVPLGVVGTFEGARYKARGRYRPTAECLMQRTDRPFCAVCQQVIADVLAAAA